MTVNRDHPVADAVIVTTDTFWEKLCDPAAVRVSWRKVVVGRTVYVTNKAPEDVSGFIDEKIMAVQETLSDQRRPSRWLRRLLRKHAIPKHLLGP